jgi:hypothetical protein
MYLENPKTKGSGIFCVIPQKEKCPRGCAGCFFYGGRSYLEPLEENLPNIPEPQEGRVYRINDGGDSNVERDTVLRVSERYPLRFYNTSFPQFEFDAPVVLTVNPGEMTDVNFYKVEHPLLMYVRYRVNTWNWRKIGKSLIMWYVERKVPVVLTWMAYEKEEEIPQEHRKEYERATRTLNEYWCVKEEPWKKIMKQVKDTNFGKFVESCGTWEQHECKWCGNCLKFFFKKREELCCELQLTRK